MVKMAKSIVFCVVTMMILTSVVAICLSAAGTEVRSNAPTLTYPGVYPTQGDSNTIFNISVTYTDADGDMPSTVYAVIDNTNYLMKTEFPDPTRGMFYNYNTKLSTGNHTYHFWAANTKNETVRNPVNGSYIFYVGSGGTTKGPQLYDHYLNPTYPEHNDTVNFTVKYKDLNNTKPSYVNLALRKLDTANDWKIINMSVSGTTYSTGVICFVAFTLTEGQYTYYFEASNINGTVLDPYSSEYKLYVGNRSQNNYPQLYYGSVSPINGTANKTIFSYNVIYQDGSFGGAKISQVIISGKAYSMTEVKGDSGSLGISYQYNTTLPEGTHNYYFMFSDGTRNVTLPSSGTYTGPYVYKPGTPVNNPPRVTLTINPPKGPINTTFYFNATGTDPDKDTLTYSWTFSDGYNVSRMQSIIRQMTKSGNYTVTVTVTDPGGLRGSATANFAVTSSNGPPSKNRPPVIGCSLNYYNTVTKGTILNISATSSYDPDGDPLTFKWDIISMNSINPPRYHTASFLYNFNMEGNYTFNLQVSDSKAISKSSYVVYCTSNGNVPQKSPTARANVRVNGMTAAFSAENSFDSDGYIVKYSWAIWDYNIRDKDISQYNVSKFTHTFTNEGYKTAQLWVEDNDGLYDSVQIGFYVFDSSKGIGETNHDSDNNNFGAHALIDYEEKIDGGSSSSLTVTPYHEELLMNILEIRWNYLKLEVKSSSPIGRLFVLDLYNLRDISSLDQIELKLDDSELPVTDLDTILQTAGDESLYYIVENGDHYQLYFYISEFSTHILELNVNPAGSGSDSDSESSPILTRITTNLWIMSGIIAVVIIIAVIIVFMQVKRKKKIEYYNDFRVADERVSNGDRVNKEDSESIDWDEYL